MTDGVWLARLCRRLVRPETFEWLVSPAIADLQAEADLGILQRCHHYAGLAFVVAWALMSDLRADVAEAFDHDSAQRIWRHAAIWYIGIVSLMTLMALRSQAHWSFGFGTFLTTFDMDGAMPWHLLSAAQGKAALTSALLQGFVSALPFGITAAAFHLSRQKRRRTIVATVVLASAITAAAGLGVRPIRAGADRALYETVAPQVADPQNVVGDTQHWQVWLQTRQREFDSRIAFWMDLQNAVMVIPFALFGIVLARRRGWGVLGGAVQIVVTLIFVFAPLSFLPVPAFPQGQWIITAGMVVAGMLRLWLDARSQPLKARES